MKLSIRYKPRCIDRPWLLVRVGGEYEQHAHLKTKKDAVKLRNLLDRNLMPYSDDFKIAAKRLLTDKEYKRLESGKIKVYNDIKRK